MAQLGYHVSKGLPLWDYPVHKGAVLYLALEDDCARLQKRLYRMFGEEPSENFYFATESKTLNEGLEQQLCRFVKEHTDTRLVIIDTLQKVREASGDKFSYSSDYEIVTKLQTWNLPDGGSSHKEDGILGQLRYDFRHKRSAGCC
jgi:RecA-family ATPase